MLESVSLFRRNLPFSADIIIYEFCQPDKNSRKWKLTSHCVYIHENLDDDDGCINCLQRDIKSNLSISEPTVVIYVVWQAHCSKIMALSESGEIILRTDRLYCRLVSCCKIWCSFPFCIHAMASMWCHTWDTATIHCWVVKNPQRSEFSSDSSAAVIINQTFAPSLRLRYR